LFAILCLFNPVTYLNSAWWGQVDSIFALLILLAFIMLYRKQPVWSAVIYAAALVVKPQALIAFPVYLWYGADLFLQKDKKAVKKILLSVLAGVGAFFLLILPFTKFNFDMGFGDFLWSLLPVADNFQFKWIIDLYWGTLDSYQFATLNAANLYGMLNMNWRALKDATLLGISVEIWSIVFIILTTALSGLVYFWKKQSNIFLSGGILILCTYLFATKMHERYMFPFLILLLVHAIITRRKSFLWLYAGFSALLYFNIAHLFALVQDKIYWILERYAYYPLFIIIAIANMILLGTLLYCTLTPGKTPVLAKGGIDHGKKKDR